MFLIIHSANHSSPVVVRKDAIRFVEPWSDGVKFHVDGIGEIHSKTYDIPGFANAVGIEPDDEIFSEVA